MQIYGIFVLDLNRFPSINNISGFVLRLSAACVIARKEACRIFISSISLLSTKLTENARASFSIISLSCFLFLWLSCFESFRI